MVDGVLGVAARSPEARAPARDRPTAARGPRGGLSAALAVLLLLLAAAPPLLAAVEEEVPFLSGPVNDYAGMIPDEEEIQIGDRLRRFEADTGVQVVVLTVEDIGGVPLEDYSLRVAETWELGQEGADNGVLLLVVRDSRQLRLEVGYGLEPLLTDLEAHRIIDRVITPRFRAGDFGSGVEAGVETVIAALEGDEDAIPGRPVAELPERVQGPRGAGVLVFLLFLVVIGPISAGAAFSRGCQSWFLFFFLMPFWVAFPAAVLGGSAGLVALGLWIVLFPLLKLLASKTDLGSRLGKRWVQKSRGPVFLPIGGGGRGRSSGGFGGGGFSSGGFSGGGGSFGGGGASGSW